MLFLIVGCSNNDNESCMKGLRHNEEWHTIKCYDDINGKIIGQTYEILISSFQRGYSHISGSTKYYYFGSEDVYKWDYCELGNGHKFEPTEILSEDSDLYYRVIKVNQN